MRGHTAAPAGSRSLSVHLGWGPAARGLGRGAWPPALATSFGHRHDRNVLVVTRRWQCWAPGRDGSGVFPWVLRRAQHPSALSWGTVGLGWARLGAACTGGCLHRWLFLAGQLEAIAHGSSHLVMMGTAPAGHTLGWGARRSRPRPGEPLKAGWAMEGCCEGSTPGARRGLSPSPFHPDSPFPTDMELCQDLLPPHTISVRPQPPARGPPAQGLIQLLQEQLPGLKPSPCSRRGASGQGVPPPRAPHS